MPITQDRILALVEAGEDYKNALEYLCGEIANDRSASDVLKFVAKAGNLLRKPDVSSSTLAKEREHYKQTHRKNNYRAEKAKEKRGGKEAMTIEKKVRGKNVLQGIDEEINAELARELEREAGADANFEAGSLTLEVEEGEDTNGN